MSSESTSPDDHDHVDATVSPRPFPPSDVPTQETGGSTNASDSTATPPVQEAPRNRMKASTIRAINDDDPPIPVWQVADHEKETKGPQLHDGPPGPPRFPQELDDSLAKKVEKKRATFPALEDRLRHEDMGSDERAALETRGSSTNVSDMIAAPMVQREVIQGGVMVSTIHAMNDDDPPIPMLQVVDHEKSEGNQAERVASEFGCNLSDHPRYSAPTVHSTMGVSDANAAEVDPPAPMVGTTTSTNTSSTGAAGRAATNSGATTAIVDTRTIVLQLPQARMVMPGDDDKPEPVTAEPVIVTSVVLPFYRQKGFVYVMVAMALLAMGIAVAVLLSSNVEMFTVTNNPTASNILTKNPINSPANNPTASNKPTTSNIQTNNLTLPPMENQTLRPTHYPSSSVPPSNNPTTSTENPTFRPTNYPSSSVFPSNNPTASNKPTTSNIPTKYSTLWPANYPTTSTYRAKLLAPPDRAAGDQFGESVAIHGDTIVVGAEEKDDKGLDSGSAHVFVRNGEEWTHQAKLLAPDGAVYDWFGDSVAIYGDAIVVGADGDDDKGSDSGSAHVFLRSGEVWTHQAKLLAPDGAAYDSFGLSVAIYGDTIVVGAHQDDDNGCSSGSAKVFVRIGEEWTHQAKLLAPDGSSFDRFGESLAVYEDTIVVGAPYDGWPDSGLFSGSTHVFVRNGEEWTHQAKLLAPDGAEYDYFGHSVAIYGDAIVVGAYGDYDKGLDSGSAHVFVRSGEGWTHQAKLLAPDRADGDRLGESVAIFKNSIVVGAEGDDDNGSAHVYLRRGEEWTHQAKLLAPDGADGDRFGESVAIFENSIVVGAQNDDANGNDSGSAYGFIAV